MNKFFFLLLLVCSLSFQSCFEIVEQISFNNDGSGSMQLTLNLSKSRTKLNSISKMKSINGHDIPSNGEIQGKLKDVEQVMKKTAGISAVSSTVDFTNYIAVLNCNFKNVASLNSMIKNISNIDGGNAPKGIENTYAYDPTTKAFTRQNKLPLKDYYKKVSNADKEIFTNAFYTSIYKFEGTVKSTSNAQSKTSASKKAVMIKHDALEIISGAKSIENKITLN